jgi:hypothetical protein
MNSITIFYEYMGATLMRIWKGESLTAAKEAFERESPRGYEFKGAVFSDALTEAMKGLLAR